jgi:hypothetical protein
MSCKFRTVFLSSVLLIAITLLDAAYSRSASISGSNNRDNAVAEYLDGATEKTRGEDHRQVLKQALTDMLDLPIERLREKTYLDYEMRPEAWSITVILERYIEPKRQDMRIGDDKFFDDMRKPEAQRAIHEWLVKLSREDVKGFGIMRPRNTVEDYLNGAEEQVETDDQRAVIKQAFFDMLNEPTERLRKKRYPNYQLQPHKWPITEVLTSYFLPDSSAGFDDDEFFRDLKKPEAQKVIQRWLDHMNNPDGKNGPAREERP